MSQVISQSSRPSPGRLHRLANPLDTPLGVGKGAVFSAKQREGRTTSALLGGFGQKNILHHQKIEMVQAVLGVVEVRIGHQRVFADDVHGFDFAVMGLGKHLGDRQPGLVGRPAPHPRRFPSSGWRQVGHRLVGRKHIGQAAHVAGPLDVVLPAQRVDAAARTCPGCRRAWPGWPGI
jgi:hypothetical protein